MDRMINYIRLACMVSTYRTCNSTVGFLKYEFNNKLLGDITLLKVTPSVCMCIYIRIMLMSALKALVNSPVKESFYGKKKKKQLMFW